MNFNLSEGLSEMSEKELGKSEMLSVETFASNTLRDYIAPRSAGANVKDRIRYGARVLGWSFTRTKDVWYADPRVSLSGAELRDIEDKSGISYGRAEARSVKQLIAQADALLEGTDEDFHRPFVAAIRALFGALDRTGTPR
jgi:hypothetical protein